LTYLEQSLAIRREIGDKAGEGTTLNNLSQIYDARGDYATALTYLEQSLAIQREIGDKAGEGVTCWNIGMIYKEQGDLAKAEEYIRRRVQIDEETGDALVNRVLDTAAQKGTGKWTSQNALDLGAPIPTINAAVESRIISAYKAERVAASRELPGPPIAFHGDRQQFILGDPRSLDEVVRELAERGLITSFCTAGYRCGRTGKCIMDLLRSGQEGKFCKLNAVLTFREWLDDFATPETRVVGERVIEAEIAQVRERNPKVFEEFLQHYKKTQAGERDLYF
jgi:tetratricopeptide (TPR) repeat protein